MIDIIVTFMGHYGHRYAEVMYLATAVVAPYVVEYFEDTESVGFFFASSEEEALTVAQQYAYGDKA